jgi:endoglucanase
MKKTILFPLIIMPMLLWGQAQSNFIAADQFGYRPESKKTAFIRNPQQGYDAHLSFAHGSTYALVNAETGQQVFTGTPVAWNGGAADESSGDKVWRFDFTEYNTEGEYYVLDLQNNVKSYSFKIEHNLYKEVLVQAFRTFYYQRFGFAKEAPYAEQGWEDGASHIGHLQDKQCRQWGSASDASTEKDVSGGWYDAGDQNKYTNWTAGYIITMLTMYEENPGAWTDDFGIPESGNGIPDIIDEARFGLDHLLRLQFSNGSCIAVVGAESASPPSSATKQSFWGGPSTSATLSAAAAYAYGSKVFSAFGDNSYADKLKEAAVKAWEWAEANPSVLFYNNSDEHGTSGLAAGQQETDDYGRFCKKMRAAAQLYEITREEKYRTLFETNYLNINMMQWWYAFPYQADIQDILLYYTTIEGATDTVVSDIRLRYSVAMDRENQFGAIDSEKDPYQAEIESYTWGSNVVKMLQGSMFYSALLHNTNPDRNSEIPGISEAYIHYIHGANPLNKCYLSNMSRFGAENSVTEFFHSWFKEKHPLWGSSLTSVYGPAPGFLVGGPNPSYDWDECCLADCGSHQNNALCYERSIEPPKNQPAQKSYTDFNNGWPLNSWSVTENSCGYQAAYLRLLSKFVSSNEPVQSINQEIVLTEGWNLFSLAVEPEENSISSLLQGIEFTEIKNAAGFYRTGLRAELQSLQSLSPGRAYLIYLQEPASFSINGKAASYTVAHLEAGWNMLGAPQEYMCALLPQEIEAVKDFSGFYIPGNALSSVAELRAGKGYFVFANGETSLDFSK